LLLDRILNRFTSDVAAVDDSLPMNVSDFLVRTSSGMFFLGHRFASCSRNLKRLVGITRSPVYSQLTSTIHGLKVIRSYHVENISSNEFFYHLDFDWVFLIFIVLLNILAIIARITQHQFSTVDIALILTYSLNLLGLFQWTIRLDLQIFFSEK